MNINSKFTYICHTFFDVFKPDLTTNYFNHVLCPISRIGPKYGI